MQLLTALLAFAAVMALMSTIVAVVIEGIISLFAMRSAGLKRLLQNYYTTAVAPRLPEGSGLTGSSSEARRFADQMVSNPAVQGVGPRRFTRLTTRQLIEQFSRTPAGQAFLDLNDERLRPNLDVLAYEFDRYSDGAREFFTRRTKGVSLLVAVVIAFSLNIDAIRLFRVMATNTELRAYVNETMAQQSQRFEALSQVQGEEAANEAVANELLGLLSTMSLPIGVSQFPYCSQYSPLLGVVDSNHPAFDARCAAIVEAAPAQSSPVADGDIVAMIGAGASGIQRMFTLRVANQPADTAYWLFSVLVAGGMIGLGAPFWFNVYRRLATLIPLVGAASAVASRFQPTQDGGLVPTRGDPGRREDANIRTPEDLVFTARASGGQTPDIAPAPRPPTQGEGLANVTGSSPTGLRIGDSSAVRVGAAAQLADSPSGGGIRRLRG